MTQKPLIGISMDAEGPGGYSNFPWYVVRENYCSSVANVGGIPFPLTHDLDLVESYLSLIDGLLITGGDYDVDPALYGAPTRHPTVKIKLKRTNFEIAMVKKALEKNIPVLGICGGHQVINVALGGSLIQHIPDEVPDSLEHVQPTPRSEPWHPVKIKKETLLHQITGVEDLQVNSGHHQAVKDPGNGVVVNAHAPDGVIEGFEVPEYRFCLGIQWHPEFTITPQDQRIFETLIQEARRG